MARTQQRSYSAASTDAALLLGQAIKLNRKERRISEKELSERVGVSRETVQRIEKGDLKVGIGLVFEAAFIVGVPLFDTSGERLSNQLERVSDKLALLPKSIRKPKVEISDDF
ncbi:MAG: helix-turn-helix transcriptional regulator [Pseudomonadota bacterium]